MMQEEELQQMIRRLVERSYSPEELQTFLAWLDQLDEAAYAKVLNIYYREMDKAEPAVMPSQEALARRLEQRLDTLPANRTAEQQKNDHLHKHSTRQWAVAAAALAAIVIVSAVIYFTGHRPTQVAGVAVQTAVKHDVEPGGDKALLTLADGTVIRLDTARNGMLSHQLNTTVRKQDGQLIIQATAADIQPGIIPYNTISTPRGGQFQVLLPDGSHVWLNAASSLKFPLSFTGNERTVELKGEGYFEIARNTTAPFFVKAGNMQVQVMGTQFNIMAYADEQAVSTTLLEGAVRVGGSNGQQQVLKPGQQAVMQNASAQLAITSMNNADLEQVVAWKNGVFSFQDATVETVMRQLSRWYDIEVVYDGPVKERQLVGQVYRSYTLSQVLAVLEAAGMHFRLENRKLVVR